MRERLIIVGGLALFLLLFAYPVLRAAVYHTQTSAPQLRLTSQGSTCVAPTDYMRTSHMRLLSQWRTDVVRHGDRRFVAFNGKVYDKSLTRTCLGCHNKQQFCDRCHAYSGVSGPHCWSCHNDPQAATAKVMP